MNKRSVFYSLIVFVVLASFYTSFLFIPGHLILLFNEYLRNLMYVLLVIGLFLVLGRDTRSVRKSYQANMVAVIAFMMYCSMLLLTSFLFGGGRNMMAPSLQIVLGNVPVFAFPLILAEYLRFRLIRSASSRHKIYVVAAMAIIMAFANLSGLRSFLFMEDPSYVSFFFEALLPAVTINAIVSFMCLRGSFFSVLVVSFVFNLGGIFSPVLPTFDLVVWSLVLCGLVFVVGIIHHYLTDDNSSAQRKRIARASKYAQGNFVGQGVTLVIAAFTVAFFLQVFNIYPVVILTGSMTGYIDRGSMVIMRRIPPDEVVFRVQEGDVLHYHSGSMELVHRVVAIDYLFDNGEPQRVFVTQGDANPFPDPTLLAQEDVIGTPIFTIPFIGYPNIIFRALTGGIF